MRDLFKPNKADAELAKDARDLKALRLAVVDAAGVSSGLWLSYIFILLYFSIAVGGVTHRDLLLEQPVKLPFLNIELPLEGFCIIGPILFVITHVYVLIHFSLFVSKARLFHTELKNQVSDFKIRQDLRSQLPINLFVQLFAGPRVIRAGLIGYLLKFIAQLTLVIGPIGLLLFFCSNSYLIRPHQ